MQVNNDKVTNSKMLITYCCGRKLRHHRLNKYRWFSVDVVIQHSQNDEANEGAKSNEVHQITSCVKCWLDLFLLTDRSIKKQMLITLCVTC